MNLSSQYDSLGPNDSPAYSSSFSVGAVSVQVTGERGSDVELGLPLERFRTSPAACDINLHVEWADQLELGRGREIFDSGAVWRLSESDDNFRFDFVASTLGDRPYKRLLVDRQFRRALLQMSEECFTRANSTPVPLEYPLDELLIMHRLTQERAIELHSCGIVTADGTGNLFVGHSGAGKSTTTRLWTENEEVEILSDDRIIVRRDASTESSPRTDDPCRKRLMRMFGTPWHGEEKYGSPASANLTRILVLEHGQGNVLTQLSASDAVAELFARAFVPFHHHRYVESALDFLQELVDAVPCYRFAFEPNQSAVERILELRD